MKRLLATMFFSALISGCATVPDLPADYALREHPSEGVAFVALTLAGKPLSQISHFEYRIRELPPADENAVVARRHFASTKQHAKWVASGRDSRPPARKAVVSGSDLAEPPDILEAGKATGRLIALHLPAGTYEFYGWRLLERQPYGQMEYGPKQPFSYRFTVTGGEAVYLGRLNLRLSSENTQAFTVEDRHDNDVALIAERYPSIGRNAIHIRRLGS